MGRKFSVHVKKILHLVCWAIFLFEPVRVVDQIPVSITSKLVESDRLT